jgi:2-dehydropantoate 2-reductase
MTNIAVIGIGGIGGYFGGKLTGVIRDDPQTRIYFVARGRHLEEIKANGLVLDAQEGPTLCRPTMATDSLADLPVLDFCLICVKGYDLADVLARLKGKIGDSTVILPLLNGVDIFERTRAIVKNGYLHPACVYISTHIEKPGVVQQRGPAGTISLGADPGCERENKSILALFDRAGIQYAWKTEPFVEIWNKFLFIAPFGLVTADSGKTIGEVLRSEPQLNAVKGVMREILALADKKGVRLPPTAMEDTLARAAKFPSDTRTSFQRDFVTKGKPDERDLFGGSILRMGAELGVPTPAMDELYLSIARKKPQ